MPVKAITPATNANAPEPSEWFSKIKQKRAVNITLGWPKRRNKMAVDSACLQLLLRMHIDHVMHQYQGRPGGKSRVISDKKEQNRHVTKVGEDLAEPVQIHVFVLVRLHEESSDEQDAGDDDEEESVLERGPQSRSHALVLLQLFKVKVGQWDPEEAKAGNQAIGNCMVCVGV